MPYRSLQPWRIVAAIAVSAGVLGLLYAIFVHDPDVVDRPDLLVVLRRVGIEMLLLYVLTQLLQATLRAVRYRLLLVADGRQHVPGLGPILLVTLARGMFVDLLPARVGELSYFVLLNRGYRIGADACLSSLGLSVIFDVFALVLLTAALIVTTVVGGGAAPGWSPALLLIGALLGLIGLGAVYGAGAFAAALHRRFDASPRAFVRRALGFVADVAVSVERVRRAGILVRTLLLSFAVRLAKYGGLYCLFLGVAVPSFESLAGLPPWQVISAFVGAEASASLPVPAFMSFGPYEAGGLAVLTALGLPAAAATLSMLAVHLYSQAIDYALGGLALVLFIVRVPRREV